MLTLLASAALVADDPMVRLDAAEADVRSAMERTRAYRRWVVLLSNDVRSEAASPQLVESIPGTTGVPWRWEYPQPPP